MEREVRTIVGKFYLKNGNVIEEKIILNKEKDKKYVKSIIKYMRYVVKESFEEDCNFQLTFGTTTFRGNELVAVKIEEAE